MLNRVFASIRALRRRRYSILIIPHHLSGAKSFTLSLPFVVVIFGLWSLITITGTAACLKAGELLAYLGETKLLATRMKVAIREVEAMRELAKGVALLEKDLKYLLGHEDVLEMARVAAGEARAESENDTLEELLMGRLSGEGLHRLQRHKQEFKQASREILNWAGGFFFKRYNEVRQEAAMPSEWPAVGVLTSGFGMRASPFHSSIEVGERHHGVDIANAAGTPVRAAADGVVRQARWISGYGRTVILDHGFGYSSLYGHTSEITVKEGAFVKRGDTIAYMGSTGRSTGNHLHFEIWQYGRPINPFRMVKLQRLVDLKQSYARNTAVEPEGAISVLGIGLGGAEE